MSDNLTADHVDEVVCTRQGKLDVVGYEDLKKLRKVHKTWLAEQVTYHIAVLE